MSREDDDAIVAAYDHAMRAGDLTTVERLRQDHSAVLAARLSASPPEPTKMADTMNDSIHCKGCGHAVARKDLTDKGSRSYCPKGHEVLDETTVGSREARPATPPPSTPADPQACPSCRSRVRPEDRFCGRCGRTLGVTPQVSSPARDVSAWARPAPVPEGQGTAAPEGGDQQTVVGRRTTPQVASAFRVVLLGAKEEVFPLTKDESILGRGEVEIPVKTDAFLSERHCRLSYQSAKLVLSDLGSTNRTFLRILPRQWVPLADGQRLRVGRLLFEFRLGAIPAPVAGPAETGGTRVFGSEREVATAALVELFADGREGDRRLLRRGITRIGRGQDQDLPLGGDPTVSRAQIQIRIADDGTVGVMDGGTETKGSSGGTFLEIRAPVELGPGACFLAGDRVFRVDG